MDEIFDVCDSQDRVIGRAPRSQVHAEELLHRAVHVWVFNSRGELMIHLRSATKDEYPNCYTSSASGHLASEEEYLAAAERELREELGLSGELQFAVKLPASPRTANEHTVLYTMVSDAVPSPDPGEVAGVEYHDVRELWQWLERQPERFSPPFRELLAWWVRQHSPGDLNCGPN